MSRILKNFINSKEKHFKHLQRLSKINVRKWAIKISDIQKGYSNFYNPKSVQPYIPYVAKGPWIKTAEGKYIYDTGGYGMLGLGHNPSDVVNSLKKEQVMANIMTPNISQKYFWDIIRKELEPEYKSILCLNSGSEVNTMAMRIANIHQRNHPVIVSMIGSFHGRTEKPALASFSCRKTYEENLSDYQNKNLPTYFINYNDIDHAEYIYRKIEKNNQFPEITLIEPVQGEGNPGEIMKPEFYKYLRERTREMGGLLLADSVQAGLRCTGELSITRYPGFKGLEPPDFETFSKAINAGQFPLSVLALSENLTNNFRLGLYGNTMTGNPRGLDIGISVLKNITPDVKKNIVEKGKIMKEHFYELETKYSFIEKITGTGLLLAIHLDKRLDVLDVEYRLRKKGLNVIHGGENALRFTPWFLISEEEIKYICQILEEEFVKLEI